MYKRNQIDLTMEEKILTALIVDAQFCREVIPLVETNYFVSDYSRRIWKWIRDYHQKYKKNPGRIIQDIFEIEKGKIKEAEATLIESLLSNLSSKYEDKEMNIDYLIDQTTNYLKGRALKVKAESIISLVNIGDIEVAESIIGSYKQIGKKLLTCVDPFDCDFIEKVIRSEEEGKNKLFKFPGALGEFLGWFERDWLVCVAAPFKMGKTFILQEMLVQGLLHGRKAIFFELEMGVNRLAKRLYSRITAYGKERGSYIYPVFDCKKNQDGTCMRKERRNKIVIERQGKLPLFDNENNYKPCTYCRDNNISGYVMSTWYTLIERNFFGVDEVRRVVSKLTKIYGNNVRLECRPAKSINVKDIRRILDNLEYIEGFIPDIVVVDYDDLLAPEDSNLSGIDRTNETYQALKSLASERHCLVCTGSQALIKSGGKKGMKQENIYGDSRKLGNVDAMYGLNQTEEEKKRGVMRIGILALRDGEFIETRHCYVLQQLNLGQPILDSELSNREKDFKGI